MSGNNNDISTFFDNKLASISVVCEDEIHTLHYKAGIGLNDYIIETKNELKSSGNLIKETPEDLLDLVMTKHLVETTARNLGMIFELNKIR